LREHLEITLNTISLVICCQGYEAALVAIKIPQKYLGRIGKRFYLLIYLLDDILENKTLVLDPKR
jgi:hypothetical protein